MKSNFNIKVFTIVMAAIAAISCTKNETKYYADTEDPGVAIFSNTGNNLLSCFVNGKPWRTIDRKLFLTNSTTSYEVYIYKQATGMLADTLFIRWSGYFSDDLQGSQGSGSIGLQLAMPHNSGYRYLSALQGQRLQINTAGNYFSTSISGINPANVKGSGNIYFHTAQFDSVSTNVYKGVMSGIFDADFGSFKITRGRFDHIITQAQINF